ncbi:MAG: protein kinase [Xanthomonadales bacterium]|nr:protein kinase [Xanthomonadales bacterium]
MVVEIPGYKLDTELGRGGMATVYLAEQQSVERQVALKVMSRVLLVDQSFSERFVREAKIAANLYHPHIVAVHDVGVHDDDHFIAMEYLSGGDLAQRCERNLDLGTAVRVVREIAGALDYAHSKGFVHRDVKPENILFRENGSAVLTDFGIARAVNSATQMTKTGAVVGTPQYMSPEQARGKDLDGRSDLYGLGIVFYEMLTGKVPFEGADSVAVGIQHVTEPVPRLPQKLNAIQPVLEKFLAKDPDDRYQTGHEAVLDLQRLEQKVISGEVPAAEESSEPETVALDLSGAKAKRATRTPEPVNVSATPQPDGSLRREPTLGTIGDIKSFDRTVGQPVMRPTVARSKKRGWLTPVLLLLVAGVAAAGWWQRERLTGLLPDSQVDRWLAQAQQASDFGRWYGETADYANVLYARVLEREPGNRQARAGMDLVARHLTDRAETALVEGDARQAEILLDRARQIAPDLDRIRDMSRRLADGGSEPEVPEEPPVDRARIDQLLAEALQLMGDNRLVSPPGDNALARLQAVLALEPGNAAAASGIRQMGDRLRRDLQSALSREDLDQADSLLAQLTVVLPGDESLGPLRQQLEQTRARLERAALEERRRVTRVQRLLSEAQRLASEDRLGEPPGDNAIETFQEVLRLDPGNAVAQAGLAGVARRYLELTEIALEDNRLDGAETMIARIESLDPSLAGLDRAKRRLTIYREQNQRNQQATAGQQVEIDNLLEQGDEALARELWMSPPGESAFDAYKAVLRMDPENVDARTGLKRLSTSLSMAARAAQDEGDLDRAIGLFGDAEQTDPENPELTGQRLGLAEAAREQARVAITASDFDLADQLLRQASDLEPDHPDLARLQLELNVARDAAASG